MSITNRKPQREESLLRDALPDRSFVGARNPLLAERRAPRRSSKGPVIESLRRTRPFSPEQGGYVYCDGQYGLQYATRSTGCWLPDMSNNVKRARIAPNSFTGQFTIQVLASNVAANAVQGRDGNAPNQDWALYVYNAIRN